MVRHGDQGRPGAARRAFEVLHTMMFRAEEGSDEALPLVGRLPGHWRHRSTAGYAHFSDAHRVAEAKEVGAIIARASKRM